MRSWMGRIVDVLITILVIPIILVVVVSDTIKNIIELLPFACFILCPSFIIGGLWTPFAVIVWFGYVAICLVKAIVVLQDQYRCL